MEVRIIPFRTLLALLLVPGCTDGFIGQHGDLSNQVQFTRGELSLYQTRSQSSRTFRIEANFDPAVKLVEKREGVFSNLVLKAGNEVQVRGFPAIKRYQIAVQNDGNQDYRMVVTDLKYVDVGFTQPWLPSKGVLYRNVDPRSVPLQIAKEAQLDEYYPNDFVRFDGPFRIRDVDGLGFSVFPVLVNNATKQARVLREIQFVLEPSEQTIRADLKRDTPKIFRHNLGFYQSLFQDFRWDYEIDDGLGDILVIHTARDAQAIQAYVEHKQTLGYAVHTVQVEPGTNVKSLVKSEYEKNKDILYVLLVGDWEDIKCDTLQNTDVDNNGSPMDNDLGMVSGSDNFMDVAIGRISANSAEQVSIQINKIIHYENNPNAPYWKSSLGIASDEGPGDDDELDQKHIDNIIEYKLKPNGWDQANKEYDPGASASGVAAAVNEGVHVINYTGHGDVKVWVSSGFSNTDVNNLDNQDRLPMIFSVACVNGRYNGKDSFAEAWMRKENGGAIAALMSTIYQPWEPPMIGQDYINDLLSGGYDYSNNPGSGTSTDHGKTRLGSIVFNAFNLWYAESNSQSDRETIKTWTLFGDPALQVVYTDYPLADFTYQVDEFEVSFSDNSTDNGSIQSWQWTFGDGATSNQQNPNHTYSNNGIYTVHLSVTDNDGKTGVGQKQVAVGPQAPQAAFSVVVDATRADFSDQSSDVNGNIVTWHWDFGDGQTSNQQNPSHSYVAGTYHITLQVYDNEGLSGSAQQWLSVPQYCPSNGENAEEEWINDVEIGSFSHITGSEAGGYGDYTSWVIDVEPSEQVSINLTPGFLDTQYNEYWRVWVDWNQDGVLDTASELVFSADDSRQVSGSFLVPADANPGIVRMRISMKYDGNPKPCELIPLGEVEDYSLRVCSGDNCSACAQDCNQVFPNATASCIDAQCQFGQCLEGFADCDQNAQTGCEQDISSDINNCGECGLSCNAGSQCIQGICGTASCEEGLADCNQNGSDGCEVNLLSDQSNCGGCGIACSLDHANSLCSSGACVIDSCEPGFADCDQSAHNGCEVQLGSDSNCSVCGDDCSQQFNNAHGICNNSVCQLADCLAGFADCDLQANNGCETSLGTPDHCASCLDDCAQAFPNADASCVQGACQVGNCAEGYADCDAGQNGCETLLGTAENCQSCGDVCQFTNGIGQCEEDGCSLSVCLDNFGNCDGDPQNGCESSLSSSTHCGSCGNSCNAQQSCVQSNNGWMCQTNCLDADKDGYADADCGGTDCNDSNLKIHPGAVEICNEVDDNCNGSTDEGFDKDNDGVKTCSVVPDCNDTNATIHPGALEVCYDGIDNDCNGLVDDAACGLGLLGCNSTAHTLPTSVSLFVLLLISLFYRRRRMGLWKISTPRIFQERKLERS